MFLHPSKGIVSLRSGDLSVKKGFMYVTLEVQTSDSLPVSILPAVAQSLPWSSFHDADGLCLDYDSNGRVFLEVSNGKPKIDARRYVPKRYRWWLRFTAFGQNVLIGLPPIS